MCALKAINRDVSKIYNRGCGFYPWVCDTAAAHTLFDDGLSCILNRYSEDCPISYQSFSLYSTQLNKPSRSQVLGQLSLARLRPAKTRQPNSQLSRHIWPGLGVSGCTWDGVGLSVRTWLIWAICLDLATSARPFEYPCGGLSAARLKNHNEYKTLSACCLCI